MTHGMPKGCLQQQATSIRMQQLKPTNMKQWAFLSRVGMWVMIGALVLSFFVKGRWVTITWISGAVLCGIGLLLVVLQRRR